MRKITNTINFRYHLSRASSVAAQMKSARLGHRLTSRMFSGISDEKIALYRAGLPARPHW